MSWQLALGLFFVTAIAQSLLQRSYSQKSKLPESFPPAISYLIGVVPLGLIVGLSLRHEIQWSWWLVVLLILEGTFIGLYNWFSFRAIKRLPVARYETIFQSYEFVVILLGWTLLAETLTAPQILGGILLTLGALLATQAPAHTKLKGKSSQYKQGSVLAIASAIAIGIGLVAEKAALKYMDIGAYFIVGYMVQAIAIAILAAKDVSRQTLKQFSFYDLKRSLAMGILSATMGFFYIIAIVKSDNISLITALSALALPLTVLGAWLVLKERENQKLLWAGLFLAFIGLIFTAL